MTSVERTLWAGGTTAPGSGRCSPWHRLTRRPCLMSEAFMDTPVVNGTAYPYINVAAAPYRLKILNACNDRMLNPLQFNQADAGYTTAATAARTEPLQRQQAVAPSPASLLQMEGPVLPLLPQSPSRVGAARALQPRQPYSLVSSPASLLRMEAPVISLLRPSKIGGGALTGIDHGVGGWLYLNPRSHGPHHRWRRIRRMGESNGIGRGL